jgi:alcohol dehydrogenase (cytochrome c)
MRIVKMFFRLSCIALVAAASARGQSTATTVKTTADVASAFHSGDWPTYNGDYTGRRYSGLTQITPANVGQLHAAWVFHSRNAGTLEVTPVVINGVMYVTASNDAYALNATDGQLLWHYSRPVTEGLIDDASGHISRGVAVWGNRLFMETDNAHLLCLDARSGHLIWDVAYADWNKNYGATSAPLLVKGKVIVGTSGGDDGVRGFIAAFDVQTGALAWRRWTIPAPGEFGSLSWPGDIWQHGGGTAWMPGTFDPELNTIYWGTGNAAPDYDGTGRPGDDLYTSCVLALDPDTGKIKWYFQFTPHDLYDFDGEETPVLVDRVYDGQPRKLLIEANRNGYIYILDRTNGEFLSATQFAEKLNWAKGIDAQGRPIFTDVKPSANGMLTCPGEAGATNWYSPTYNEGTQLFYFLALDECTVNSMKPEEFEEGKEYYATGGRRDPKGKSEKRLIAFDPATRRFPWIYPQTGRGESWGGVMSTASGLVFFADDSDSFEAVDAKTGKSLWHFNTGQSLHASPMSYAVDGHQYVAIASGDDLFIFTLP